MSREDTAAAKTAYDEDLTKLWNLIKNADQKTREKIISNLDEKTTFLLRTRQNPYQKPVYKGNKNKLLCFNVINLREKYLQRFAMTSLIGFLYRMLDEFEPPGAKDYESQNDAKFAKVFNVKQAEAIRKLPETRYRETIKRLRETIQNTPADADAVKLKLTYHDLYVNQARMNHHMQYYLGKDRDDIKYRLDMEKQDLDRATSILETVRRRLAVTERKRGLKEIYDKSAEGIKLLKELEKNPVQRERGQIPDYAHEDPKTCILTEFDKSVALDVFDNMITLRKKDVELVSDDVARLTEKVSGLQNEFDSIAERIKRYATQFKQLKSDYNKHFKPADPHPLEEELQVYELTDDEYDQVVQETKREVGIEKTREEYVEERRAVTQEFLDEYLVYNPDNHVQCAYKPNYDDPLRTPLKTAWLEFHETGDEAKYNAAVEDHAKKVTDLRVIKEAEYERKLVPPDDTFFRWQRYIDNNYEELRQATDDIYCEKSDVEFSLVPLQTFEGELDDIKAQAAEWQRKYAEEFEGDVYQATFGVHNMLGSWSQNRERRDFYTKNSEILKRIIQQNEDDQKMGKRLMKERADKKRKENEDEVGPNATGLKDYRKNRHGGAAGLEAGGAKHMEEIDKSKSAIPDKIPDNRSGRKTQADRIASTLSGMKDVGESSKDEVEVGWHNIRPERRRGRIRAGKTETSKFHIPTDAAAPAKGYVMKPGDMHKHIGVSEMKEFVSNTVEEDNQ